MAPGGRRRPWGRTPRGWVRLGALGLAVAGFMAGSALSVRALSDYQTHEVRIHRAGAWMAVQAQVEHLHLLAVLERGMRSPDELAEVPFRFDLLWSRLPLILASDDAEMLQDVPDAVPAATDLLDLLRRLDPVVQDLARSRDPAAAGAVLAALGPFGPRLHRLVQGALLVTDDQGGAKAGLERRAMAMLGFTFAAGALLVVMLLAESRAAAREQRNARLTDLRLRGALEAGSVGFVLFDENDRLLACNDRFRRMYDLAEDEVRAGVRFEEIMRTCVERERHAESIEDGDGWFRRRLAQFRSPASTHEQRLANGRWLEVRERRLPEGGSIGVRIDITELKRREQALADALARAESASRAKSEFLANMSHELRTPLNAVIGFSELMRDELLGPLGDPRYAEYADDIHASGRHLLGVINDVLDMARIEAGGLTLDEDKARIEDVVVPALRMVRQAAAQAGIEIALDLPPGLPPVVLDVQRMRQVLVNLLSNAIKFTETGGAVRVVVSRDRDGVEIRVRDTGIGMSEAEIGVALLPFGQVDGSFRRRAEGTGLGLPISAALVERHGGTLAVESRPGEGTTVRVRLPASRVVELAELAEAG
jgi:two-component system cell cycle sensor histidine kinase PleC